MTITYKPLRMLDGKKTRIGKWLCVTAGCTKIASAFYPILSNVGDGLFYMGIGLIGLGIYARFCRVFYNTPGGVVNLRQPKITPKTTRSG
jgi:hypothetical protein